MGAGLRPLDKKVIIDYIKPQVLKGILERQASLFGTGFRLLDPAGAILLEATCVDGSPTGPTGSASTPLAVRGRSIGTLEGDATEQLPEARLRMVLESCGAHICDLVLCEIKLDSMSEELLQNYKVLNLFYNVSHALVNILNVRKVCEVILDRIVATIGISKASVLLLDESREYLSVVAHQGLPEEEVRHQRFTLSESVCRDVIVKGKPLFIQNIDHYPDLQRRSRGTYRSKSFVSVPILKSARPHSLEVLGVINIADKNSGDPFYSGDMKLIIALTSLAAMSIENAVYFEEVARSKEVWEGTFDAITDSVAILDRDYQLLKLNKAYDALGLSATREALLHQTCYRAFYQREAVCPDCPVTETLASGKPAYAEKAIGGKIFRQWTYPMLDEAGRTTSVVMYTRNVTNLKKLQERLTQSERMASIGQIASGMAHEIRNPLSSIVTAVDVLSSGGGTAEENFFTLTDVIRVEANRLNDIITEFLLYAAPQPPVLAANRLNEIVQEVARMMASAAEKRGIEIVTELDPAVGSSPLDGDKIKQVIWNLGLNGIEAMASGGQLTVATRRVENGQELCIRDKGQGIGAEHRSKIFDPFFTTKPTGTGLGLSVVSRIVEGHRGTIDIQSRPGGGTEFVVTLPSKHPEGEDPSIDHRMGLRHYEQNLAG